MFYTQAISNGMIQLNMLGYNHLNSPLKFMIIQYALCEQILSID